MKIIDRLLQLGFSLLPSTGVIGRRVINGSHYLYTARNRTEPEHLELIGDGDVSGPEEKIDSLIMKAVRYWMYGRRELFYTPSPLAMNDKQRERAARRPPATPPLARRLDVYKKKKAEAGQAAEREARWAKEREASAARQEKARLTRIANAERGKDQRELFAAAEAKWFEFCGDRRLAHRQAAYERNASMRRMHEAGFTYRGIAEKYGVSPVYVSQCVAKSKRAMTKPAPIEDFTEEAAEISTLSRGDMMKLRRPGVAKTTGYVVTPWGTAVRIAA